MAAVGYDDPIIDAPQLGEYAWHAVTGGRDADARSAEHERIIRDQVARHLRPTSWRGLRLLEVAAARHHTIHGLSERAGATCVVADISPTALSAGLAGARRTGVARTATPVVADFHDLPFSDGWFDLVFVSAAVHHSWHPEVVLRELARVVAYGGLLVLTGEQCARVCCFYAFRCNRADALTPFESFLLDRRLLETFSSPFWGSRPEILFGMVENDRIPAALWRSALLEAGRIQELTLGTDRLVGPLEERLLAVPGDGPTRQAAVGGLLAAAVDEARTRWGEPERRLGHRLPSAGEVHALARHVSHAIGALRRREDDPAYLLADLVGADLAATVRRAGRPSDRDRPLFRRSMDEGRDGLWREAAGSKALAARIATPLLPDVFRPEHRERVEEHFPPSDWLAAEQPEGVSLVNLSGRARVALCQRTRSAVLLVRYHAVLGQHQEPYRVRISHSGAVLDEQLVVQQETRLARAGLGPEVDELVIEIVGADGTVADVGWQLRLSVLQLVAIGG